MNYVRLDRLDGPPCPKCGCQDTEVDQSRRRWQGSTTRYRCRNCNTRWYPARWRLAKPGDNGEEKPAEVTPGGALVFHVIRCPDCGSRDTVITSTRRPVRQHKCRECGATFKSVERDG